VYWQLVISMVCVRQHDIYMVCVLAARHRYVSVLAGCHRYGVCTGSMS